jgi:hypothetical protein
MHGTYNVRHITNVVLKVPKCYHVKIFYESGRQV